MTELKVLPWREGWAGRDVLLACRGGVSQRWLGVVGLHLLGLFRGERLLGGPGGASAAALRRAGPPRHLGMLPDAWRLETLKEKDHDMVSNNTTVTKLAFIVLPV